jgi:predicted metal-dependent phosphoesterase TrpH
MVAPQAARRFDLHLHSARSDGRCAPDEVVRRCAAGGLDVIALTDHDLALGLAPGAHEVGGRVIHLLSGAELSGVHEGHEYHLLVYFPEVVPEGFRAFCQARAMSRSARYERALESLGLEGLEAPDDQARAGEVALTRHHLARALIEAGHARDLRDAFSRFAHRGHVPPVDLGFVDAIRCARSFGGLTSWAHPPVEALEDHLETFVAAGLQGLEGVRPFMNARERRRVLLLARRHGLFVTGGSDWHGWHDGEPGLFSVERAALGAFLETLEVAV